MQLLNWRAALQLTQFITDTTLSSSWVPCLWYPCPWSSAKRTAQSHWFLNPLPRDSKAITYPNIKLKRSDKLKYLKCFTATARKVCFCSGYSAQSYALLMLLFWSTKLYSKSWQELTWKPMVGFGGVLFCFTASSKLLELNSPCRVVNCLRLANAWQQGDTLLFSGWK